MANVMSIEKRNTILRLLVEGNSIRSTCRLMGSETDGTGMPTSKNWEVEVEPIPGDDPL